jgi:hypothetical protein
MSRICGEDGKVRKLIGVTQRYVNAALPKPEQCEGRKSTEPFGAHISWI